MLLFLHCFSKPIAASVHISVDVFRQVWKIVYFIFCHYSVTVNGLITDKLVLLSWSSVLTTNFTLVFHPVSLLSCNTRMGLDCTPFVFWLRKYITSCFSTPSLRENISLSIFQFSFFVRHPVTDCILIIARLWCLQKFTLLHAVFC